MSEAKRIFFTVGEREAAQTTEGHTCNEILDKKDFLGIISGHKMTIY